MRKLMFFTIGFAAACAISVYLMSGRGLLLAGMVAFAVAIVAWCMRRDRARVTAVIILGCAAAFLSCWVFDAAYLSAARAQDGQTLSLCVTATDFSYETDYGSAFDGKIHLDDRSYHIRCYLDTQQNIAPGDRIQGEFRLRFTAYGGEEVSSYHQGKGIFLLAYQRGDAHIEAAQNVPVRYFPAVWRERILSLIGDLFPEDTFAFAKALLLGDTSDLSYTQDRSLRISGIRHVVAVSGLHVSILICLVMGISGYRRVLPALLGIPLLVVFAALSGFTPSVVRACTMYALMLLALLVDKEYDPPTALAFAVLAMLAINPLAVTSVSLQLSVACTAGILLFENRLREYLLSRKLWKKAAKGKSKTASILRWIIGTVSVTLSAMVLTTPLCAAYFGVVSVVGILTNLLALWVVSGLFYGIMLSCLLGFVWLPLGQLTAWVLSWVIRYVLGISRILASIPFAAVYTDSIYTVIWLVFAYLLLGCFFMLGKKQPLLTACCIAASLCVCIVLSWVEPRLYSTGVSVINVGQGQCILLKSDDAYYLVDCGSESGNLAADKAANHLLSQGIFSLDGIILTHYDMDHAGSVTDLLSSISTDAIYMPDTWDDNGVREEIEAAFSKTIPVSRMRVIPAGKGSITLFPSERTDNDNESSMCVLFQTENCDILITGDRSITGERELLDATLLPRIELLVVGHHGAKNAAGRELLHVTQPVYAAISSGEDNRYGHPHSDTLGRLEEYGCTVLRTDLQGTIIFRR